MKLLSEVRKSLYYFFFFDLLFYFNVYVTNFDSVLSEKDDLYGQIVKGNEEDAMITRPGIYDVKLSSLDLRFTIQAEKCYGKLTVCYDSAENSTFNAPMVCQKSKQTGFALEIDPTRIRFMNGGQNPENVDQNGCQVMENGGGRLYDTGRPLIKPGYILTLNVIDASPYCPLIVKYASLAEPALKTSTLKRKKQPRSPPPPSNSTPASAPPPTKPSASPKSKPTPPPARTPSSTPSSTRTSATELPWYEDAWNILKQPGHFGYPKWVFVIFVTVGAVLSFFFILLIGLCIYVKCFYKKKNQAKRYEIPKLSNKKIEVEEKKESNKAKAATQPEPSVEPLPEPAINLPVSTLDVSPPKLLPPHSTKLPPSITLDSVKKVLAEVRLQRSNPTTTTSSAANGSSKKSQKTDPSLPETNKKVLIEPHYASLLRHKCLGINNSAKAREMRRQYPRNIGRILQHREIKVFTLPVNEMFIEVDKMCREAERDLKTKGIEFDEEKGITKMTENGRKFIESPKTPDFIAYFAFGAEYFEFVNSDISEFCKYSVPLLFTISMIPRIDDTKRRKALTWIRRQIPKIREQFSSVERETMAFPINAIEKADEMSQNGSENLDKLLSMSRILMEDKTQRDLQEAAENRSAGRIGQKKNGQKKRNKRIRDFF